MATLAIAALLLTAGAASGLPANGKIAFGDGVDVFVMDADGSNVTELTNGENGTGKNRGDEPAWSNDGTKIAYSTQDSLSPSCFCESIVWVSADGGPATTIVDGTDIPGVTLFRKPSWSPDDSKIAFHAFVPELGWEIYSINVDGTGLTRLTDNAVHDLWPAWSHDGTRIAFESFRDGDGEIWVMGADGSNPAQLTSNPARDLWPSWSPDDSQIAFYSNRDGNDAVYKMNADGTNQVRLTSFGLQPDWSPDGTKIAFIGVNPDIPQVVVMNVDGSSQTQITDAASGLRVPAWQPLPAPPPPPPAPGTIRVLLDANPDGPQDFSFTGSGAIGNFDLDDDSDPTLPADRSFPGLAPGSYTVQQIVPSGWTVVGLTCDDPDSGSVTDLATATATIDLDAGETVACQYTDVPLPPTRIRIDVDAVPDDPQDFSYTGSGAIASFSLDDDADPTLPSSRLFPLSPGSYSVEQAVPAGWDLTALTCADPDGGSSTDLATATATIDLDAGETIACTFTNTKAPPPATGRVRIELDVVPDDPQDFSFGFSGGPYASEIFFLDDDGGSDLNLDHVREYVRQVGSYSASQHSVLQGGSLTALTCADPDSGSSTDLETATATIDLDAGETVACTFTNTKDTTPPTLSLPAGLSVDATSPAGATVVYSASASDLVDASPSLTCVPVSGSLFPIGTTTVNCTATDDAGNSATGSFVVTVLGAGEQIAALIDKTRSFVDSSVFETVLVASLRTASEALAAGRKRVACVALDLYIAAVRVAPSRELTAAEKAELLADARRIRAVIGC